MLKKKIALNILGNIAEGRPNNLQTTKWLTPTRLSTYKMTNKNFCYDFQLTF